MTTKQKFSLGVAVFLTGLALCMRGCEVTPSPDGAVGLVVYIEESGDRTPEQAAIVLGPLSQELRKAMKWRLWDKDEVPEDMRSTVASAVSKLKPPFVLLMREGDVVAGPTRVDTETALAKLIEQNGGY